MTSHCSRLARSTLRASSATRRTRASCARSPLVRAKSGMASSASETSSTPSAVSPGDAIAAPSVLPVPTPRCRRRRGSRCSRSGRSACRRSSSTPWPPPREYCPLMRSRRAPPGSSVTSTVAVGPSCRSRMRSPAAGRQGKARAAPARRPRRAPPQRCRLTSARAGAMRARSPASRARRRAGAARRRARTTGRRTNAPASAPATPPRRVGGERNGEGASWPSGIAEAERKGQDGSDRGRREEHDQGREDRFHDESGSEPRPAQRLNQGETHGGENAQRARRRHDGDGSDRGHPGELRLLRPPCRSSPTAAAVPATTPQSTAPSTSDML